MLFIRYCDMNIVSFLIFSIYILYFISFRYYKNRIIEFVSFNLFFPLTQFSKFQILQFMVTFLTDMKSYFELKSNPFKFIIDVYFTFLKFYVFFQVITSQKYIYIYITCKDRSSSEKLLLIYFFI